MVLDAKKDRRSRGAGPGAQRGHPADHTTQQQQQQQPQPDRTRPLGLGMAHATRGEELQRQRIMSASRLAFFYLVKV